MSGLFGNHGSPKPERYAGMQLSSSLQGQVIPLVWGRNRITMNLIWYGNFQSHSSSQGGGKGGGGQTTGWVYSAAYIAALCMGPIKGIDNVYHDRSTVTLTYENLEYALGGSGQATWGGYPSGTPAVQQIPYDHLAYVASQHYSFGSSAAMPNLTFEVEGVVGGYYNAGGVYDADVSAVLTDYLTDPVHGAGFQGTINTALLTGITNTFQAYCMSLGIVLSPYENSQRSATDFLKEIMQITNSDIVMSGGVLKVIPYADQAVSGTTPDGVHWSYTPNLTPLYSLTDSDYCPEQGKEPVRLTRKALADTYNIVNVEYVDRSNYYNPGYAGASDLNDISSNGPRLMSTLSFHGITQASVARTVAQLILQYQLYERNTYEFRVRADYSLLEPMDYIAITDSGLGLVNQVCRVLEVQDDKNHFFTIKCMEVPGTVRNTPVYNWAASQGYAANFDAQPLNVAAPRIFVMPAIPAAQTEGTTLGVAVCGQSTDGTWGGCEVHMSVDGGSNYFYVGLVGPGGIPRYGTISSAVAAVADPDTSTTMGISLINTNEQLSTAVTHADADSNQTLVLVGSGSTAEVMSYGAASLVSAGNYNLSYLRRNLYGSGNYAHSNGDAFVRLDGSIFQVAVDPGMAGQTVYFKFCSFNTVGRAVQDLSTVTAYAYTVPGALSTVTPLPLAARGSCAISDTNIYKITTGSSAWDSDCVSAKSISAGNVSVEWGAGAIAAGFVTSTGSTANPNSNMYCVCANSSGQVQVIENGTVRYTSGSTATVGDLYDVLYDGYTLDYYVNGTHVWSTPLQRVAVYAAIAMYTPGAVVSNIQAKQGTQSTPTRFVSTGNAVCDDNSFSKIGGATGWDSQVRSIHGYQTCHLTFKSTYGSAGSLTSRVILGLSDSPTQDAGGDPGGNLAGHNYNWYCDLVSGSGNWIARNGGTALFTSSANVSTTDIAEITYDGSTVTFYLNKASVATVTVSGLTLYMDGWIYDVNGAVNSIDWGPTTNLTIQDTGQLNLNVATDTSLTAVNSFSTSAVGFGTPSSGGNLASIAIPNYPYAITLTVVTQGQVSYTPGAGSPNEVSHYVYLSTGAGESQLTWFAPGSNFPLENHMSLNLPANYGAFTVYSILGKGETADTCTFTGAVYAEVIKR